MISTRWLDQRTPHWRRLEALLDRIASHGFKALDRSELQELGLLYRQIAADLAAVREDPGSARFALALNLLLVRAHHTIYSAERPAGSAVVRFLRDGFPKAVRAHWAYCAVAVLLFIVGASVGAAVTFRDPDFAGKVLGPKMMDTISRHQMWTQSIVAIKPLASSAIMTNNMSVTFMVFASGITAGIGTVYMVLFNGLLIGVVGAACAQAGLSVPLWSFVAPHGVLELPAIFIAGGAGLRLGQGVLFPGFLPRRDAVALAGSEAVSLILGCIPMLVIAGLIEAFISPTDLSTPLKFGLAGALFSMLVWYLAPRRPQASTVTPDSAV